MILQFAPILTVLLTICIHRDHASKNDIVAVILAIIAGFFILSPWGSVLTDEDLVHDEVVYGVILSFVAMITLSFSNVLTRTNLIGADACHWLVYHQ